MNKLVIFISQFSLLVYALLVITVCFFDSCTWEQDERFQIACHNDNQRARNKLNKNNDILGHKWPMKNKMLKSHRSNISLLCEIIKTMCLSSYHHLDLGPTHAHGHMRYGYTSLVPMNQRALKNLDKQSNITDQKWSMTHTVLTFHGAKWA